MKQLFASIFTTVHKKLHRKALSLFLPRNWKYFTSGGREEFISTFREVLNVPSTSALIPFYNARSALYHGISYLGIGTGDEIILQGYTCISVPNAIIATGAIPIYVDIDASSANIDPQLISQHISPKTKAIFVQHTFGIVADMKAILSLCKEHDLLLIEDCAHALGAKHDGKFAGTYGDMAIYSFGRDKVLTSTNGGMLLLKNTSLLLAENIMSNLKDISLWLQIKNLMYLVIGWRSYITYRSGIGKVIYYIFAKLKLFPLILFPQEKVCEYSDFNYHYPHVLAHLASKELESLNEISAHRQAGYSLYKDAFGEKIVGNISHDNIYLRVVYLHENPPSIIKKMKSHGVHLGDPRYDKIIAGRGCDLDKAGYIVGSCPKAEQLASRTVNLPNHRHMGNLDYKRVINLFS